MPELIPQTKGLEAALVEGEVILVDPHGKKSDSCNHAAAPTLSDCLRAEVDEARLGGMEREPVPSKPFEIEHAYRIGRSRLQYAIDLHISSYTYSISPENP